MKKSVLVLLYTILIATCNCAKNGSLLEASENVYDKGQVVEDKIDQPNDWYLDNLDLTTDLEHNPSTTGQVESAGYDGSKVENFSKDRIVTFSPKGEGDVSDELNSLVDKLSKDGGGKIIIPSGEYIFQRINLKSNIHISIESGTTLKMDNSTRWKQMFFLLGSEENSPLVENVKIVGLGTPETRPKLILQRHENTFYRAFNLGHVKNVLIKNFTIVDNLTKGAAIAFNPVEIDEDSAHIPENVTVSNVSLSGGSVGYGLVQTNVGRNILLENLHCEGGVTCRVEAHNGRRYDLGIYNLVIQNVVNKDGKATVLLQPHSVENGRVLVDKAVSDGSTWTLFIKEGFVHKESKRKKKGSFDSSSTFKNIALISSNNRATLSYKNFKYVPEGLHSLYKNPNFTPIADDANNLGLEDRELSNESAVKGASVAVVFIDASYSITLPDEKDIILSGKTDHRLKILRTTK